MKFSKSNFQTNFSDGWDISRKIACKWLSLERSDDKSTNTGSGNSLAPSDNKPLPDQYWPRFMFTYGRGHARGPAGFDAPFNMGSTKCKIEWNGNFEVRYLTD